MVSAAFHNNNTRGLWMKPPLEPQPQQLDRERKNTLPQRELNRRRFFWRFHTKINIFIGNQMNNLAFRREKNRPKINLRTYKGFWKF